MSEDGKPESDILDGLAEPSGLRLLSCIHIGRRSCWVRAEQTRLNRIVALKYLRPEFVGETAAREAFLEAGRSASTIVHPAAVPIINVFLRESCIAMHYCPGRSLRELAGGLEPALAARIGATVMDCLAPLHATGRCHGNLGPGNLFVDVDEAIWVNDFYQPPLTGAAQAGDGWRSDVFQLGEALAAALTPDMPADELRMLVDALRSETPDHRGGSPQAVHDAFIRIRRLEELRIGRRATEQRAKRMYRRIPAAFEVTLQRRSASPGETASILMKTRDIGESGVFVETNDELLGVGSILELDFTLRGVDGNVHALGIVRWRSQPPMVRGVGVQFVEVDQAGLARLREYLGRREGGSRTGVIDAR